MPLAAPQDLSNFGFKQLASSLLTLSGTTNFIGTLKSKGMEIDAAPSHSGYTTGGTGATVYVLTLLGNKIRLAPSVGGGGGGTGTNVFNTNRPTTRSGIPIVNAGVGGTVQCFLEKYFFPAVPPSSSMSIVLGSSSRQFGDQSCSGVLYNGLGWNVVKNTNSFTGNIFIDTCGLGVGVYNCTIPSVGGSQSGAVSYCICGLCAVPAGSGTTSTSQTFKICALTTAAEVTQGTTSISWQNKRFWLKSTSSWTSSDAATIQALLNAGSVIGSELSSSIAKTFSPIAFSGEYFYYVYPKFLGTPTFTVNALPNNAWGNGGTGTLFTINYTNNNGYTIPYYVAKSDQALSTTFNIVVS